jgi:hypothetical protein
MTVTVIENTQIFVGDGIATVFPFTIQTYSAEWIFALVNNVEQSHTVNINADQESQAGGTVTFDVPPALATSVVISRQVPLTQLVDFPEYGAFPARNNEDGLDKITMALSQFVDISTVNGKVNRAGDTMSGQLNVPISPSDVTNAVSQQYVMDYVASVIGGLSFLGFWDASTNITPPAGNNGDLWFLSSDGTLDVSDGTNPPAPTAVFQGERLVYDGSNSWWVYIPSVVGSAIATSYDPTGTDFTAANVQDALNEVDTFFGRIDRFTSLSDIWFFSAGARSNVNPIQTTDLCNKNYVDNQVSAILGKTVNFSVDANGAPTVGSGMPVTWSIVKGAVGLYTIIHNEGVILYPVISPRSATGNRIGASSQSTATQFDVATSNSSTGEFANNAFHIMVQLPS